MVVRDASAPMQIIDVRDVGAFPATCTATRAAGAFDGAGPFAPTASLLAEITPPGVTSRQVEGTLAAARIEQVGASDKPAWRGVHG